MHKITSYSLLYHRDSASLIATIGQLCGATCLDSGLGQHPNGRYDILSAMPECELRAIRDNNQTVFQFKSSASQPWTIATEQSFPLLCQQILNRYRLDTNNLDPHCRAELLALPFAGGFMGVMGYHFLQLEVSGYKRVSQLTPALTHLQEVPDAWMGWYAWFVIVDHQTKRSRLIVRPECSTATVEKLLTTLGPWLEKSSQSRPPATASISEFKLKAHFRPLVSKRQYVMAFDQLQHWIHAGDCYQTNLALSFTAPYKGDPLAAYLALRKLSHSPFSAYVSNLGGGVLSLSPERFIQVNQNDVLTQPIKGTRPRHTDPEIDSAAAQSLTQSEKDRAENLMIVDLLRNDLGRICATGSVKVDALFELQSFSQVHHLVSTIRGRLPKGVSALQLLISAFPGGSITGAPKIRAMQIISELETVPRSAYCGSVFYLDEFNRLDSNIAIRTMQCTEQDIFCWGGSGVVADSDGEEEYQECHDKVSALLSGLTLAN